VLEKTIQQKIMQFCKTMGIIASKIDGSSRRGLPDLLVILPNGTVIFTEVKTPTGKLTPLQKHLHERWGKQNANIYTVSSLDEFKATIATHQ